MGCQAGRMAFVVFSLQKRHRVTQGRLLVRLFLWLDSVSGVVPATSNGG